MTKKSKTRLVLFAVKEMPVSQSKKRKTNRPPSLGSWLGFSKPSKKGKIRVYTGFEIRE